MGISFSSSVLSDTTIMITFDYISGCKFSGCFYNLTSVVGTISGIIEGNSSDMINVRKETTYVLTVRDLLGFTLQSEKSPSKKLLPAPQQLRPQQQIFQHLLQKVPQITLLVVAY